MFGGAARRPRRDGRRSRGRVRPSPWRPDRGRHVLYGSGAGLSPPESVLESEAQVLEAAEAGSFGAALAADLNGDSRDDLAGGSRGGGTPSPERERSTARAPGSARPGTSSGVRQRAVRGEAGDSSEPRSARALNGDSRRSRGRPGEGGRRRRRRASCYGAGAGLGSAGNQFWSQDSARVGEAAEADDSLRRRAGDRRSLMPTGRFSRRNVLVAGAGGFIGGHLVAELLQSGARAGRRPEAARRLVPGSRRRGEPRLDLAEQDACQAAVEGATRSTTSPRTWAAWASSRTTRPLCMLSVLINTHC